MADGERACPTPVGDNVARALETGGDSDLAVPTGRPIAVGALCELDETSDGGRTQRFSVSEFLTLEDGRVITLHRDRGFALGWRGQDPPPRETEATVVRNVLNVVLPDDDRDEEEHPWPWLVRLAQVRGIEVTVDDLRALPYQVVLGESVRRSISPTDE